MRASGIISGPCGTAHTRAGGRLETVPSSLRCSAHLPRPPLHGSDAATGRTSRTAGGTDPACRWRQATYGAGRLGARDTGRGYCGGVHDPAKHGAGCDHSDGSAVIDRGPRNDPRNEGGGRTIENAPSRATDCGTRSDRQAATRRTACHVARSEAAADGRRESAPRHSVGRRWDGGSVSDCAPTERGMRSAA